MFKPPAHKAGSAGQVNVHSDARPLTNQIDDYRSQMSTTQRGKLAAAIGKEMTALEASKAVLAPYPQEPWESRYNGLVRAIRAIEAEYEASVGSDMDIYSATDKVFALVKENT